MNEQIERGLSLLEPGQVVPVDVATVAALYAALKYVVERDEDLASIYLKKEKDNSCPVCRQDVMMLTGTGLHWFCGTCGHREKVEPEEP